MPQIRDLEASVEMLSGGKDEALSTMRKILKGASNLFYAETALTAKV